MCIYKYWNEYWAECINLRFLFDYSIFGISNFIFYHNTQIYVTICSLWNKYQGTKFLKKKSKTYNKIKTLF